MRVVLDTNVFVSAVFFAGVPGRILDAWENDIIRLVLSPEIFDEYSRVLNILAKKYPRGDFVNRLERVISYAEFINAPSLPEQVSVDLDDDKFLACAVHAKVNLIVSGDSDLLQVSGFENIAVLTPKQFCSEYLDQQE